MLQQSQVEEIGNYNKGRKLDGRGWRVGGGMAGRIFPCAHWPLPDWPVDKPVGHFLGG